MRCPRCGRENPKGASACSACDAPLPAADTRPLAGSGSSRSMAGVGTRPLAGASTGFGPLPEGALLGDGRYEILETSQASERSNAYLAQDLQRMRPCANCRKRSNDLTERFCSSCGADLSVVEPLQARYVVRESLERQAFSSEIRLLETNLRHPGLSLPCECFAEAPYGAPRHYLVAPAPPALPASKLTVPHEVNQVLEWGRQLAGGLAALHRHHFGLRQVDLDQIIIEGGNAAWICTSGGCFANPPPATRVVNVSGLAGILFYLATGRPSYAADVPLPDQVRRLFSAALITPPQLEDATALEAALSRALEYSRPVQDITLGVGRQTDVGRKRKLNEDSLLDHVLDLEMPSGTIPVGLFAVADGMGGHDAGDVASRLTVETIEWEIEHRLMGVLGSNPAPADARRWLLETVRAANNTVFEQRAKAETDMGTTLVMAMVVGDSAVVANVGDSRAYLVNRQGIARITTDHSLVERLVVAGQITREEAATHPQRNIIYRTIGERPDVEADLFEQHLSSGDALLLCSDGLNGMLPDDQIWQVWYQASSPQESCDRLVEAANQAGGTDNITVMVVQVGS